MTYESFIFYTEGNRRRKRRLKLFSGGKNLRRAIFFCFSNKKLLDKVYCRVKESVFLDQIMLKLHTVLGWPQEGEAHGWKLRVYVCSYFSGSSGEGQTQLQMLINSQWHGVEHLTSTLRSSQKVWGQGTFRLHGHTGGTNIPGTLDWYFTNISLGKKVLKCFRWFECLGKSQKHYPVLERNLCSLRYLPMRSVCFRQIGAL